MAGEIFDIFVAEKHVIPSATPRYQTYLLLMYSPSRQKDTTYVRPSGPSSHEIAQCKEYNGIGITEGYSPPAKKDAYVLGIGEGKG